MKKNILRFVALLLIFCVFAGFPLKAKATEVAAYAALSVGAQNLIAGLFNACGLGPGGDPQPFYDAVNQCISDLHLGEIIQGVTWAFSGFQRFAVPVTLAEQVRDWLWDSSTIVDISPRLVDSSYTCPYFGVTSDLTYTSPVYVVYYCTVRAGDPGYYYATCSFISKNSFSATNAFSSISTYNSSYDFHHIVLSQNQRVEGIPSGFTLVDRVHPWLAEQLSSADEVKYSIPDGFQSGTIASRYNAITEGYPAWGEGIISVDPSIVDSDEEESIPYIPVGVGQTLEESAALTQEQAQSGVSTIEVSVEIPDDTVAGTKLSAFFSSLLSALSWTSIKTWIEGIWTSVLSIPDAIANLHSLVLSIPQAIADVLADIFIPAEDYISVKVDALAVEYAFVPDIVNSVTLLKNNLVGDCGPPVIYVDFGRAGGSTNYGGKVLLTDFAWYEEYKPTVDALLSAALWAFFLWRVFLKLPGIIGGESGAVGSVTKIASGVSSYSKEKDR